MTQKEFLTGSDHHVWWSLTLVLEIWVMCIKHSEYKLIVHSLICGYFWNWPDRLDKFFLYLKGINNLERSLYIKNKRYLTDVRVFGSEREREKDRETYNQKMVNIYVLYHLQETVLFYPSSCLLEAERQLVCEYFDQRWSTICLSASFTLLVIYPLIITQRSPIDFFGRYFNFAYCITWNECQ